MTRSRAQGKVALGELQEGPSSAALSARGGYALATLAVQPDGSGMHTTSRQCRRALSANKGNCSAQVMRCNLGSSRRCRSVVRVATHAPYAPIALRAARRSGCRRIAAIAPRVLPQAGFTAPAVVARPRARGSIIRLLLSAVFMAIAARVHLRVHHSHLLKGQRWLHSTLHCRASLVHGGGDGFTRKPHPGASDRPQHVYRRGGLR